MTRINIISLLLLAALAAPVGAICGDCNQDGVIDARDPLQVTKIAAGLVTPTGAQLADCDVNGSMTVSIIDMLIVAQHLVGLPVTLAC